MFLGHDVELISREGGLKFLDLWNTAWTKGNTRCFMEFLSKANLHSSTMVNNALVLWVFVVLCLRDNNCTSTAEVIFVFNLDDAVFFSQVTFKVYNITAFSSTILGHFNMDHVDVDRIIQSKLRVGLYDTFYNSQETFWC